MNTQDTKPEPRPRRWTAWGVPLLLALIILFFHGPSLGYGLFMDDWAHAAQLRAADWSLGSLVDACRLELVGGVCGIWWLPETTLRFFRPVAFGLMKLVYTLSDWSPAAAHAASLAWHLLVCVLLWRLLERLGVRRPVAVAVTLLFAIHPAHVATVQWIAAQSELMVTAFALGALLCVVRLRGWGVAQNTSAASGWGWGVAALVLFAAALGCRENAIMLPLVVLAVDVLWRRASLRAAVWWYVAAGVLVGAYLTARWAYLGGAALPPRPYVVSPADAGFWRYVFDKACYYLLGEYLLVPCVPIGGLAYLRSVPVVFYGMAALMAGSLGLAAWRRRRVGVALGLVAMLGFMLPVLPAFESPHHLYLPGVGAGLLAGCLLGGSAEKKRRGWGGVVVFGCVAAVFALMTHFSTLALDTGRQVEAMVVAEMAQSPEPIRDGDVIYYANMPMLAHYTQLALEARTGRRNLRVVALNWAPRIMGVTTPTELRRIDDHTIEIRVRDDRFFAGVFARLIAEANGESIEQMLARPRRGEGFAVELAGRDAAGITALRFRFDRAIGEKGVHLFWGSRTRWAAQVSDGFFK